MPNYGFMNTGFGGPRPYRHGDLFPPGHAYGGQWPGGSRPASPGVFRPSSSGGAGGSPGVGGTGIGLFDLVGLGVIAGLGIRGAMMFGPVGGLACAGMAFLLMVCVAGITSAADAAERPRRGPTLAVAGATALALGASTSLGGPDAAPLPPRRDRTVPASSSAGAGGALSRQGDALRPGGQEEPRTVAPVVAQPPQPAAGDGPTRAAPGATRRPKPPAAPNKGMVEAFGGG